MPDWKAIVEERIASLHLEGAIEADLTEEIARHLQDRYRQLCDGGASPEEAFERTISEVKDLDTAGTDAFKARRSRMRDSVPVGDSTSKSFVHDFGRDLRYAIRAFRKNPIFVVFIIV